MSDSKPHIHILIDGFRRNGSCLATIDLADYLHSTGRYRVTLLNYKNFQAGDVHPRTEVDVQVPSLRGAGFIPEPWRAKFIEWRRRRALSRAIRTADLVVTSHSAPPMLPIVTQIAARLHKPLCCVLHVDLTGRFSSPDYTGQGSKALTLDCYRHASRIICVGGGLREDVVRDLPERADDILAIPNGVDLARLDRLAVEDCPNDRPLPALPFFVGVGRLVHQKGFDILLRAHALVLRQGGPRHAIVLVGEGQHRAALDQLAQELGVQDTVVFHGYAANPFPIMARAAAQCTPSRYDAFSLVTAEAAALGVPIIATDCPHGPAEILENGRYGELLPPENPERLAAAMLAHLGDARPLRQRAEASFRDRARLSAEHCHRRYAAVFDALVAP